MDETEIEFLKLELARGPIAWRDCDGGTFFVRSISDAYKEAWEEIESPVAFLHTGCYVDLTNTDMSRFYSLHSLAEYF